MYEEISKGIADKMLHTLTGPGEGNSWDVFKNELDNIWPETVTGLGLEAITAGIGIIDDPVKNPLGRGKYSL